MKYPLTFFAIFFICVCNTAHTQIIQKDTTIFFLDIDSNFNISPTVVRGNCIGKWYHKNNRWYLIIQERFKPYKVMTGSYRHEDLSEPDGEFTFFKHDAIVIKGIYQNGQQNGPWKKWTIDGRITDSIVYDHGDVLANAQYKYHENNTLWRYSLNLPLINEKVTREFDTANMQISQGRFKGNSGEMYMYYPGGQIKSHSIYKDGKRILDEQFDEKGNKK